MVENNHLIINRLQLNVLQVKPDGLTVCEDFQVFLQIEQLWSSVGSLWRIADYYRHLLTNRFRRNVRKYGKV